MAQGSVDIIIHRRVAWLKCTKQIDEKVKRIDVTKETRSVILIVTYIDYYIVYIEEESKLK